MPADRRTRILVVAQPVSAGVPHHVIGLLPDLVEAGFRIDVMCPRRSVLWAAASAHPGVSLHPMPDARTPHPGDLAVLLLLVRLLRRVDVVHAHSSKAGMLVRAAALVTGRTRRVVFTPHGWSFWACEGRAKRFVVLFERLAARWCATIVAVSAYERDAGLAVGVGRRPQFRVIPNGVDPARFAADPAPVPGRIVMVGRMAEPKRHDLAIRALAVVRRACPAAHLELVGDGPLRPGLEALAEALGVTGAVAFLGDRDDVAERLRAAACVLLASRYEGCSLAVLEAMAAGRPVVASRVGGMDELVEDGVTGRLVANVAEELAAALLEVIGPGTGGEAMGAAGRSVAAERFAAGRTSAGTIAAYRALLH